MGFNSALKGLIVIYNQNIYLQATWIINKNLSVVVPQLGFEPMHVTWVNVVLLRSMSDRVVLV